ncbi:MAG: undecaprenyl-diphosphate phosphatase [Proteobacteria bacterium]|nr:undecaprenyl-diphosphate phosphatase [Pseudomonadota bacterium]
MEILILLAAIQGITEFLPISSSAHLILLPRLFGASQQYQGLVIDIAVHLGSLGAVIIYNIRLLFNMARSVFTLGGYRAELLTLTIMCIIASLPLMAAGYLIAQTDLIARFGHHIAVIGWATLLFGLALGFADRTRGKRRLVTLTMSDAIIVGLIQPLALIPGASRAGLCMTAARLTGLGRVDAIQFAMLLSIPAILGASVHSTLSVVASNNTLLLTQMAVAAGLALGFALLAISLMIALVERFGMLPFVIYRVLLGGVLIILATL